jgi:hypothetical protein
MQPQMNVSETILEYVSPMGRLSNRNGSTFLTFCPWFVRTFSDCIWILKYERETFFDITETTMAAECGASIDMSEL